MTRRAAAPLLFAVSALAGLGAGLWLARRHDRTHREALFSRYASRRYAALGWLASEGDSSHLPLLLDYLAWEAVPALRVRAQRLVDTLRLEAA